MSVKTHPMMLAVVLLLFNVWTVQVQAEFMKGVNYGNRFTPEAWMNMKSWTHEDFDSIFGPKYGPPNVTAPHEGEEPSLCDVPDSRILNWLNDTIEEEDFRKMKEYGVKLLRLPTGYFNWVDEMPEVPDDVAPRIRNLQVIESTFFKICFIICLECKTESIRALHRPHLPLREAV